MTRTLNGAIGGSAPTLLGGTANFADEDMGKIGLSGGASGCQCGTDRNASQSHWQKKSKAAESSNTQANIHRVCQVIGPLPMSEAD